MALVKCKECGKEISDKADVCVHCGMEQKHKKESETVKEIYYINQAPKKPNWFGWFIASNIIPLLLIGMGGFLFIIGQDSYYYDSDAYEDYVYPRNKYINGDAYNYMIEASLMGGEISGSRSANATYELQATIYICSGFIIASMGLSKMRFKMG